MARKSVLGWDDQADSPQRTMEKLAEEIDRSPETPVIDQAVVGSLFAICSTGRSDDLQEALKKPHMLEAALTMQERRTGYIKRRLHNLALMLEKAARAGNSQIVKFLLGFSLDHNIPLSKIVERPVVHATIDSNDLPTFQALATAMPACINFDLGHVGDPLSQAIWGGSRRRGVYNDTRAGLVAFLLNHGADPNKPVGVRHHRLQLAASSSSLNIVNILLQHGSKIPGSGAVHEAAAYGRIDVLETLLNHDADIEERLGSAADDWFGNRAVRHQRASETPLRFAVEKRQHAAVAWLLDRGADADVKDAQGLSLRDRVAQIDDQTLSKVFRDHDG